MNKDLPQSLRIVEKKARLRQAEKNILLYQLKKESYLIEQFKPEKMDQDTEKLDL